MGPPVSMPTKAARARNRSLSWSQFFRLYIFGLTRHGAGRHGKTWLLRGPDQVKHPRPDLEKKQLYFPSWLTIVFVSI